MVRNMIRNCVVCGKEFDTMERGTSRALTCSEECRINNRNNKALEYRKKIKGLSAPTKKSIKKKHDAFVDINEKAHALGLTYGQYVGLYMNGGN